MNTLVIKFTNLNHTLRAFVSIFALGLLSGCVGTSAFQKFEDLVESTKKSIVLVIIY